MEEETWSSLGIFWNLFLQHDLVGKVSHRAELEPCPEVTTAVSLQQGQNELSGECVFMQKSLSPWHVGFFKGLYMTHGIYYVYTVAMQS